MMKLSICIPTYNRAKELDECLSCIVPQIIGKDSIEIVISDNNSDDNTEQIIQKHMKQAVNLRYSKNSKNLGVDLNTIACIQNARGEYISMFSDDDIALDGAFDSIISTIKKYKPSVIHLNYYPFKNDWSKKQNCFFKEEDVVFKDGRDLLVYCGLAHFSAISFKRTYALEFIPGALEWLKEDVEPNSSFCYIATHTALTKKDLSVFIGRPNIAARVPEKVNYDVIKGACLDYAFYLQYLEKKNLIDHYRVKKHLNKYIKHFLPKKIVQYKCFKSGGLPKEYPKRFFNLFGKYPAFYLYILPVLVLPKCILWIPAFFATKIQNFIKKRRYK